MVWESESESVLVLGLVWVSELGLVWMSESVLALVLVLVSASG